MAERQTRTLHLDLGAAADPERIPAVLSSEFAVNRGSYLEILRHTADAVDLSQGFLPLIVQHDSRQLNIGVVEHLRLEAGKLRGTIKLGKSAKARELWEDIKAGVIRSLSIGYEILKHSLHGDRLIASKWRPLECSLVGVPADPTAGLFRHHPDSEDDTMTDTDTLDELETETKPSRSQRRRAAALERETEAELKVEARREAERVSTITSIANHFKRSDDLDRWIGEGYSVEQVRAAIKERIPDPIPSAPSDYRTYPAASAPIGDKRILRHFGENTREAQERAHVAGQWIRATVFGDRRAQAFCANRGMGISGSSSGGVLAPNELSSAIISLVNEYGVARAHARVWPMSSDKLDIPRRKSGLTGYFVGEASEITASDMTLDMVTLTANKYAVRTLISTELAEDAVIDVASLVAEEMAWELARIQDECAFNGDGTSAYGRITGIRTKLAGTAGAVDAGSGHDTFPEITMLDLGTVMSKLPSYARRNAAWFVSPEFNDSVFTRLAVDSGGVTMAELGSTRLESFLGYPVILSDVLPGASDAADGVICALFGDMRQAVALGDRRTFNVRVDDISRLAFDQLVVQSTSRFDINCHDVGDASSAGPMVGLVMNS